MKLWQNLPFLLIWGPMLLSGLTAALKPKWALRMALAVPLLGTLGSGALLAGCLGAGGSFLYPLGEFGAPVGNELRAGPMEALLALAFCLILFLSVLGGYQRIVAQIEERRRGLYCVMVLLLQAGLMAQTFTNDAFTAYVFIEIMTIAAGALVLARNQGRSLFGATRYMIMNLLGSGLFLLGLAVLYCLTGELLMEDIHEKLLALHAAGRYARPMLLSTALITVGLAVKSALYPFHTWLPDAYASATPSSSAMLSSLVSKAYIFLYVKFVLRVWGLELFREMQMQKVLLAFACIGILLGSIDAVLEKRLRRMIAYSSVAQIGYIYLGVALGAQAGVAAALFHTIAHALAKALLFLSGDRLIGASDGESSFHELRGAGYRAPLSGAAFAVGACSIVGIPLLGGFASKLYLTRACLELDPVNAAVALIVLALSTALNATYFLTTVITLYQRPERAYSAKLCHPPLSTAALAAFALLLLALGIWARPVMEVVERGVALMV